MKFALCALALFAVHMSSAQQPEVSGAKHYVVSEAKTISVKELEHRYQSKARGAFIEAKLAVKAGDHRRAITLFEKVVKIDPEFSDARNDLAVELIVCGEVDRAVDQLQQLVQVDPNFIMGYTNLGVVLCKQKKYSEAEAVLRHALAVDPQLPKANLLLAISLHGQGKEGGEIQSALEIAAKSSPLATKLLREWYGATTITEASAAN